MELVWLGRTFNFNFKTALWKATKSALVATLSVILASGAVDVFFDTLTTGLNPLVPVWLVPVIAASLSAIRNFIKQWASGIR